MSLAGTYKTVGSMVLTRGNWLVLAKEWFEAAGVPSDVVTRRAQCRVVIVGTADESAIQYGNNASRVAPMFQSMVQGDNGPFTVKARCRRTAAGGSGSVSFVKVTAVRLGRPRTGALIAALVDLAAGWTARRWRLIGCWRTRARLEWEGGNNGAKLVRAALSG